MRPPIGVNLIALEEQVHENLLEPPEVALHDQLLRAEVARELYIFLPPPGSMVSRWPHTRRAQTFQPGAA